MTLGFQEDSEGRRRRDSASHDESTKREKDPSRRKKPAGEVGQALRSAYDRMVEEDIPPEMLDLLGKLG